MKRPDHAVYILPKSKKKPFLKLIYDTIDITLKKKNEQILFLISFYQTKQLTALNIFRFFETHNQQREEKKNQISNGRENVKCVYVECAIILCHMSQ